MAAGEGKEKSHRRVYVLPAELVDRVLAYQKARRLPSEVEAVRRLLDDALRSLDDAHSLAARFQSKMRDGLVFDDICKDVLFGHPLVKDVKFERGHVVFSMSNGDTVSFHEDGIVEINPDRYNGITINYVDNNREVRSMRSRASEKAADGTPDDDLPF